MSTLTLDTGSPWEEARLRDLNTMQEQFIPHSTVKIPPDLALMNGFPMVIYEHCNHCNAGQEFRLAKAIRGSGMAYYSCTGCGTTLTRGN